MRESLLEILAEPGTGAPLRVSVTKHQRDRIEEGTLTSERTERTYPIRGGIPRFVPETTYTDTFGRQWNRFRTTQLDSTSRAQRSRRRFDAEIGWSAAELEGKRVLDAGCGAGRFAEIAAARGASLVALDMSSAVEAVKTSLAAYDSVDVVQGSLLEPPFKNGSFDFGYSIGVMQHTPDPARGLETVLQCIKPGGRFAFTIYARRPWTKLNMKYLVRPLTRRIPSEILLRGIEGAMPVLFPVLDRVFRIPVLGTVMQFSVPVAVYADDAEFTREQRYEEAILDTFDMLSPRYDSPMTWQEVERAFRSAGAADWSFQSRVPVVVGGHR